MSGESATKKRKPTSKKSAAARSGTRARAAGPQPQKAQGERCDGEQLKHVEPGERSIEVQRDHGVKSPLTAGLEQTVQLAAGSAMVAILHLFGAPMIAAAAVGGFVGGATAQAASNQLTRWKDRGEHWRAAVREAAGSSDETWARFQEAALHPDATAALVESFEEAMKALDVEVVPLVARLGASYAAQRRGPDGFFRDCAALLRRLQRDDLAPLQQFVEVMRQFPAAGKEVLFMYRQPIAVGPGVMYQVTHASMLGQPEWPQISRGNEIAQLLADFRLARLSGGGAEGPSIVLAHDVSERLAAILGLPPRAES